MVRNDVGRAVSEHVDDDRSAPVATHRQTSKRSISLDRSLQPVEPWRSPRA